MEHIFMKSKAIFWRNNILARNEIIDFFLVIF